MKTEKLEMKFKDVEGMTKLEQYNEFRLNELRTSFVENWWDRARVTEDAQRVHDLCGFLFDEAIEAVRCELGVSESDMREYREKNSNEFDLGGWAAYNWDYSLTPYANVIDLADGLVPYLMDKIEQEMLMADAVPFCGGQL